MTTTVSYSLQPIPKWYFSDLTGKPLSAGYMVTWSSLAPYLVPKFAYRDPNGTVAWPQKINFDINGSQGPFYWQFDSAVPNDLYFLAVYDVNNNLQFTINNYGGPGGSGGGGGGTTYVSLKNYLVNNTYQNNIGSSIKPLPVFATLAPGAHEGFVSGANVGGSTAPDITFNKSNTASTDDQILFSLFPQGVNTLGADVTPVYYLNYQTDSSASGETYKYVQYPLVSKVQNLSNTQVTFTFWARCNSGANQVQFYLRQFYGDGPSASLETRTPIGAAISLTGAWTQYTVTTITPNSAGQTIGECHNDGLYLQLQYPLSAATNIDHTKPCMYLGAVSPIQSFDIPDEIDSLVNTPRVGDIKITASPYASYGWVAGTDGTIGNPTSNATTRANFDTFPLFNYLWPLLPKFIPMYNSSGAAVARGATSIADYAANNQISLPAMLNRVLAGTATILGQDDTQVFTVNISVSTTNLTVTNSTAFNPATPILLTNSGGALPTGLSNAIAYYPIIINATTIQLSIAAFGAAVNFSSNGSGTSSLTKLTNAVGVTFGEIDHTQTTGEVGVHTHALSVTVNGSYYSSGTGEGFETEGPAELKGITATAIAANNQSAATPFNIVQPTAWMNFFIKL